MKFVLARKGCRVANFAQVAILEGGRLAPESGGTCIGLSGPKPGQANAETFANETTVRLLANSPGTAQTYAAFVPTAGLAPTSISCFKLKGGSPPPANLA